MATTIRTFDTGHYINGGLWEPYHRAGGGADIKGTPANPASSTARQLAVALPPAGDASPAVV